MSVGLHCRLVGRPGRAAALARFLDYARGHDRASGSPRRLAIARHWAARHPAPAPRERPVGDGRGRLRRALRRRVRAFAVGRGARARRWSSGRRTTPPAGCTTRWRGRSARRSEAERLGVLTAHPDLAGKLAAAKRLTPKSTAEQAGGRARRADRRRARALHRAQRRLHGEVRLSVHHRGARARQGRHPRGVRDAASPTTARRSSPPPAPQVERIALLRLREMLPE